MSDSQVNLMFMILNFSLIFLSAVIVKALFYALGFVGWNIDQNILTVGIFSIIMYNILCIFVESVINSFTGSAGGHEE